MGVGVEEDGVVVIEEGSRLESKKLIWPVRGCALATGVGAEFVGVRWKTGARVAFKSQIANNHLLNSGPEFGGISHVVGMSCRTLAPIVRIG